MRSNPGQPSNSTHASSPRTNVTKPSRSDLAILVVKTRSVLQSRQEYGSPLPIGKRFTALIVKVHCNTGLRCSQSKPATMPNCGFPKARVLNGNLGWKTLLDQRIPSQRDISTAPLAVEGVFIEIRELRAKPANIRETKDIVILYHLMPSHRRWGIDGTASIRKLVPFSHVANRTHGRGCAQLA